MITLILGPNNSGKSARAEALAASLSTGVLYYIATMEPFGEAGLARVEKHIRQREGKGFVTVEKPVGVAEIPLAQDAVVLLEDISNLLGNSLRVGADAYEDITALCAKCRHAVLVSIDGLAHSPEYDKETASYIDELNRLNARLCALAGRVVRMGE